MRLTKIGEILCLFFIAHSFAMEKLEKKYFIHQEGTHNGIWVDEESVKNSSQTLRSMLEDLGDASIEIPLAYPIDTIKLAFHILHKKIKNLTTLSLEQLINVANLCNFLDVPLHTMNLVLTHIKKNLDKAQNRAELINSFEMVQELDPDLQKIMMLQSTINHLKYFIIQTYAQNRKKILSDGHITDVHSIVFSPRNNSEVMSISAGQTDNCIMWKISNPDNITGKRSFPMNLFSIAWSPDSTKVALGSDDAQNNLILLDISDPNKNPAYELNSH